MEYVRSGWNKLSLAIITLGLLDIIIGFTLPAVYGEDHNAVAIIVVIFVLFRVIRLFRLLEVSDRCKNNSECTCMNARVALSFDDGCIIPTYMLNFYILESDPERTFLL